MRHGDRAEPRPQAATEDGPAPVRRPLPRAAPTGPRSPSPPGAPRAAPLLALLDGCGGNPAGASAASAPAAQPDPADVSGDARSLIGLQVTELKPQAFTVTLTAPG